VELLLVSPPLSIWIDLNSEWEKIEEDLSQKSSDNWPLLQKYINEVNMEENLPYIDEFEQKLRYALAQSDVDEYVEEENDGSPMEVIAEGILPDNPS